MLFSINEFSEFRTQDSNEEASFDTSNVEVSPNTISHNLFCWVGSTKFEVLSFSFSKNKNLIKCKNDDKIVLINLN